MLDQQQYTLRFSASPSWGLGTDMWGSVRVTATANTAADAEIVEILFTDRDGTQAAWLASQFANFKQHLAEGLELAQHLAASPQPTGQYNAKVGPWVTVHTQKDGPFITVSGSRSNSHFCALDRQRANDVLRDWSTIDAVIQEAVTTFRRMRR